jgi:hypothetical protein
MLGASAFSDKASQVLVLNPVFCSSMISGRVPRNIRYIFSRINLNNAVCLCCLAAVHNYNFEDDFRFPTNIKKRSGNL